MSDEPESLEGIDADSLEDFGDELPLFTSHRAALAESLRDAPRLPRDQAAVHLAFTYADMLDDALDRLQEQSAETDGETDAVFGRLVAIIARVGPRYEAVLDKLGMSPGARPATRGGDPHGVSPAAAALTALQSGDAPAGVDYAASVDPAVTAALTGD